MVKFNKVRSPDYPFPVIFFKKDLENIRSHAKTKKELRELQSIYFGICEIISDIEEGIVEEINWELFLKSICEIEAEECTDKYIENIKSRLLTLQNLGINTFTFEAEG